MKTIPLSEVERIVRETGERILERFEELQLDADTRFVTAEVAYQNAIEIIRLEFELPTAQPFEVVPDPSVPEDELQVGTQRFKLKSGEELRVRANRAEGKTAQAEIEAFARAAAPCPHPARDGKHEWYLDNIYQQSYVCRACGARISRKQLREMPQALLKKV